MGGDPSDEATAATEVVGGPRPRGIDEEEETQVGEPRVIRLSEESAPDPVVFRGPARNTPPATRPQGPPRWRPSVPVLRQDPPPDFSREPRPPPRPQAPGATDRTMRARPVPEVTPRQEIVGSGTKAAAAEMQEQYVQARAQNMNQLSLPALRMASPLLDLDTVALLQDVLQGKLDDPRSSGAASVKRAFERLVHDRDFGGMAAPDQAILLSALADASCDLQALSSGLALVHSQALHRLNPALRERLLTLFRSLDLGLRDWLARLCGRYARHKPALDDRDRNGTTLVQHLLRVFTGPDDGSGSRRSWLGAVAHPEKLAFEAGPRGWAGSLEFALACEWPAEWTRILVAGTPTVALADGRTVEAPHRFATMRDWMMGLAHLLHPETPGWTEDRSQVDPASLTSVMTAVFGRTYRPVPGLPESLDEWPTALVCRTARGDRILWAVGEDAEAVKVRAPHGKSSKPTGAMRTDPERKVVDPNEGFDAIGRAHFEATFRFAVSPSA